MSVKLMYTGGGIELPIGYIFEFDPTGITGAPDLSTAQKVHDYFGYGTWEAYGAGRVTIGVNDGHVIGSEGGEETHTLTVGEMPRHNHDALYGGGSNGQYGLNISTSSNGQLEKYAIQDTGGSQPHNNMQPYRTVYRWRRIA